MNTLRQRFLRNVGQTSDGPMLIEVDRADGIYLYGPDGRRYIDLISGVSVSNVGHNNRRVIDAVCDQARDYMHLMVYGEMVERPQVMFAEKIVSQLPDSLNSVYFVNSGSEANEGAMKLAKRATGRTEMISFRNAYHGSTHGALSVMGDEYFKHSFRPLLPDVRHIRFNELSDLQYITTRTACVIVEPVQGEGGFVLPADGFLQALRNRCTETGTILIFDEIQTGFGRTGAMFALTKFGVTPDILTIAKAMGGGMPIGGFVASRELMGVLKTDPPLGHITTFGGHPVSCAAGLAALNFLIDTGLVDEVEAKSLRFASRLVHPSIREVRRCGLMLAVDFGDSAMAADIVSRLIGRGVVTEWFLFCDTAMRIAPPLTITEAQIDEACDIIMSEIEK